jgi:hypothetical protein
MKLYEIMGEANRIATRERIKEILWMPFALCYTELVKTGDIPPLKDLDQKTKEKYWGETAGVKQEFYSKGRPVKRYRRKMTSATQPGSGKNRTMTK